MLEIAEAGAAVFFFNGDAQQPELAHLRPQLARELIAAVDLVGARRDLVLRKFARGLAQHVDLFAEAEIETAPGVGDHGPLRVWSDSISCASSCQGRWVGSGNGL